MINNFHPNINFTFEEKVNNINFTFEEKVNNMLSFLDVLLIYQSNGTID